MKRSSAPRTDPPPDFGPAPSWIRPRGAEQPELLAFQAGAALAALHPVVAQPREDVPAELLRDRLALRAAEACARLAGRPERVADLRDEVHLLRPGGRPGPAGAIFDLWRAAVRTPLDRRWTARMAETAPVLGSAESLTETLAGAEDLGPVAQAGRVLARAIEAWPREEAAALVLAEATLCRALGWDRVAPLLSTGLRRGDLRAGEAALTLACHRAAALGALEARALAEDLSRRAARLRAVAPKLRAKAARAAVDLFLAEDALSPAIALSPVIRGSAVRMTDRAARRLCDRLVALGVARELTGRSSFRLYGL
ncbi:MAG: hypothetical protein DI556_14260 [Rhodovulum sulfidophilum]|uniref:DUF1403 family protein n=1 Tax=Rhodovulum sulfidophilum TaxID=35806 RepID=A0A2W5Q0L9_RHOSU|nr:MAG: hypothetical protein DI556_14260 [Rhodovulum sulfidophilum]